MRPSDSAERASLPAGRWEMARDQLGSSGAGGQAAEDGESPSAESGRSPASARGRTPRASAKDMRLSAVSGMATTPKFSFGGAGNRFAKSPLDSLIKTSSSAPEIGHQPRVRNVQPMPGPGQHRVSMRAVYANTHTSSFGSCRRRHVSDAVDPDEPPGPGSHKVRKEPRASDRPAVGMSQAKRDRIPGMGPAGVPGPGSYPIIWDTGRKSAVHLPCPPAVHPIPGPADYDPLKNAILNRAPMYRPLHQTAARKSPFVKESSHTQKATEAMLTECAMEIARSSSAEQRGFGAKPKEASPLGTGPQYTLGARRPLLGPGLGMNKLGNTITSFG